MGIELYKIAVKFEGNPETGCVVNCIKKNFTVFNISVIEDNIQLEVYIDDFCVEICIIDVRKSVQLKKESNNKKINTKLYICIAKTNEVEIIEIIMQFLKNLNSIIKIIGILDIKTGIRINLEDYSDFKNRFKIKSEIFKSRYPNSNRDFNKSWIPIKKNL